MEENGGTKFTSCNLKVHWRSDGFHDVYNVVKNIDVVKKRVQNMKPSTNNEKYKWWLVCCGKNTKTWIATLFVDFAENKRNRLFEASDSLLAEAPRLFLSGSLAHPRRLPQVPRSFWPLFFFFLSCIFFGRPSCFCFLCGVYFEC